MKLKLFPPHIVRTVDDIKGGGWGQARAMFVTLEKAAPDYVYQHELAHVKQFYLTLGLHGVLYRFVKRYRLWSEVQAYKQSIRHGRPLASAAKGLMWDKYGFDLTLDQAKSLLE